VEGRRSGAVSVRSGSPGDPAVVAWIERALGPDARAVRIEDLPPSGTTMHLIEVALPDGSTRNLILRRYHDALRLGHDPWYVPAHEALALRLLAGTPVPAPRLFAADLESVCDVPALLESWLPGHPAWRPDDIDRYLARTAEVLVAIHSVKVQPGAGLPGYAPYNDRREITPPRFIRPGLWERIAGTLDAAHPPWDETFIHRDYHPGNILWDGTTVTGVVDWATAAWGPPGIDLARMRQNLAIHIGGDTADRFAAAYVSAGGAASARAPYWDLLDAADLIPDFEPLSASDRHGLERFHEYVEGVLSEC